MATWKQLTLLMASCALSTSSFSAYFSHPNVLLQAGGFSVLEGKSQHIGIDGLIGDDFSVRQQRQTNGLVGIGIYYDGIDTQFAKISYGIDAYYLPVTQVQGNVTQEQLFTNLSYHYSITYWPVYLAAKAVSNTIFSHNVHLTFDLGVGPDIINTSHFSETSLDGGATSPDKIFSGQTAAAWSGMVGVGVKKDDFIGQTPLECGYRFFYLGHTSLDTVNSQALNSLKTGNSYANAVVCSVWLS